MYNYNSQNKGIEKKFSSSSGFDSSTSIDQIEMGEIVYIMLFWVRIRTWASEHLVLNVLSLSCHNFVILY